MDGHYLVLGTGFCLPVIFQCNAKWKDFYGKQYDASFIKR
jgi:hypothetical protein